MLINYNFKKKNPNIDQVQESLPINTFPFKITIKKRGDKKEKSITILYKSSEKKKEKNKLNTTSNQSPFKPSRNERWKKGKLNNTNMAKSNLQTGISPATIIICSLWS